MPPTIQNTYGAPHRRPKTLKSSLADAGARLERPLPKLRRERLRHARCARFVVHGQRVATQGRELWWLLRAGGHALGTADAVDRRQHVVADVLVVRAHVQLDGRVVGDDVLLRAGLERADGDDRAVERRDLADTIVCSRSVVAAAMITGSIEVCGCEPCEPRPNSVTCRLSPAERMTPDRWPTVPAAPTMTCCPRMTSGFGKRSAILSSIMLCRAAADLFARLEHDQRGSAPELATLRQDTSHAHEPRHVQVMAARMRDTDLDPSSSVAFTVLA